MTDKRTRYVLGHVANLAFADKAENVIVLDIATMLQPSLCFLVIDNVDIPHIRIVYVYFKDESELTNIPTPIKNKLNRINNVEETLKFLL